MRFVGISLLCFACPWLLCSSMAMICCTLVLRGASSADAIMSASHSTIVLSWCLEVFIYSYRYSSCFSFSDSYPHSWARVPAWLCTSAWHSAGNIERLLVETQSQPALIGKYWMSMPLYYSCFHAIHHKWRSSKRMTHMYARVCKHSKECRASANARGHPNLVPFRLVG